ncbi:hypothetical protein Aduo_011406 [Ancylostoma duodenale]
MVKSHRGAAADFEWTEGMVIKRTGRVTYEVEIRGNYVIGHAKEMRKVMSGQKDVTFASLPVRKSTKQRRPPNRYEP